MAVINGVIQLTSFVTVEKDEVRRDWQRVVRIEQDPQNRIWYWAGRTAYVTFLSGPGGMGVETVADNRHWDFDDFQVLMQTAMNNYKRHLGLPH